MTQPSPCILQKKIIVLFCSFLFIFGITPCLPPSLAPLPQSSTLKAKEKKMAKFYISKLVIN